MNKLHVLAAVAAMTAASTAVAAPIQYNCLPYRVKASTSAVTVRCAEPTRYKNDWRQGYPFDGSDQVKEFTVAVAANGMAHRLAYLANLAQTAQTFLRIVYNSGATSAATGCTGSCRVPSEFHLMNVGKGGTMPYNDAKGVSLYPDPNFGGTPQKVEFGVVEAVRGEMNGVGNDNISSIKVEPGFRVVMCTADSWQRESGGDLLVCRYYEQGQYPTLPADIDNQVSLVAVFSGAARNPVGAQAWFGANQTGQIVNLHFGMSDANKGEFQTDGTNPLVYYNDALNSLVVFANYRAVLCASDSYVGTGGDLGRCRYFAPGTYPNLASDLAGQGSLAIVSPRP